MVAPACPANKWLGASPDGHPRLDFFPPHEPLPAICHLRRAADWLLYIIRQNRAKKACPFRSTRQMGGERQVTRLHLPTPATRLLSTS
jgi:hypothetical protein